MDWLNSGSALRTQALVSGILHLSRSGLLFCEPTNG